MKAPYEALSLRGSAGAIFYRQCDAAKADNLTYLETFKSRLITFYDIAFLYFKISAHDKKKY